MPKTYRNTAMKKTFSHFIYYLILPICYLSLLYLTSALLDLTGGKDNLGAAMAATYGFLFLSTPILTLILMRFSMLPWIVDPFAAAALPLTLYLGMIFTVYRRCCDLIRAFGDVCISLADDGGEGYLFLCGMFVFGLVCSISFRRMKGDHLPGRIRRYFMNRKPMT